MRSSADAATVIGSSSPLRPGFQSGCTGGMVTYWILGRAIGFGGSGSGNGSDIFGGVSTGAGVGLVLIASAYVTTEDLRGGELKTLLLLVQVEGLAERSSVHEERGQMGGGVSSRKSSGNEMRGTPVATRAADVGIPSIRDSRAGCCWRKSA